MQVRRYPENPLVSPSDVKPSRPGYEVIGAFNAGIIEYNGEVLMLMRVAERPVTEQGKVLVPVLDCSGDSPCLKILTFGLDTPGINCADPRVVGVGGRTYLTSISHLRLARSPDGRNFVVEDTPALFPELPSEAYGLEDPRITLIDDTFYIVYKAVSSGGIVQTLATTRDFVTYERQGIIFVPENMDAMIFPEKVGGRFVALHRPLGGMLCGPSMWIAYADDPRYWGENHLLLAPSSGGWDSGRVGGGAVPFLTERGWVEIYHAATSQDHYCLGALLLDREHPERMLAKSPEPIMVPEAPYETKGFKDNVVFTCGLVQRGDLLSVYYGAADETMCGADMSLSDVMNSMKPL